MALPHLVWFKDVGKDDGGLVGGKGANLGEMVKAGFPVPNGFIVTSAAYFYLLEANNLMPQIKALLEPLDVNQSDELDRVAQAVRRLIVRAEIPDDLAVVEAINLLTLFDATYRPIKKGWLEEI